MDAFVVFLCTVSLVVAVIVRRDLVCNSCRKLFRKKVPPISEEEIRDLSQEELDTEFQDLLGKRIPRLKHQPDRNPPTS